MNPCEECPWETPCVDDGAEYNHTVVHTCKTCCVPSLSIYKGDGEDGGPVPIDCPRWEPLVGNGLDCAKCVNDRGRIARRHPLYEKKLAASADIFRTAVQGNDELGTKRAIREWVDLTLPTESILAEEDFDNPSILLQRTDKVFQVVYALAMADNQLGETLNKIPEATTWRWDFMMAKWAETLFLAIQEHGDDHEAVAREYILEYTDGFARHSWNTLPLEEKQQRISVWKEYIKHAMDTQ